MKHTGKILIFLLLVFSCGRSQKLYTEEERDAGVYIVNVSSEKTVHSEKIVK